MADMGLDSLFGQEELLTDLAVHEPVRDQLKNFALPRSWFLFKLTHRRVRERNDGDRTTRPAPRRSCLKSAAVIAVAVEDLLALGSVHAIGIGAGPVRL